MEANQTKAQTEELIKLEKMTGLTCIQKNRQRIFCPNNTVIEYWAQGAEVFVKNFPTQKTESLLFCLFNECGRIMQTRLIIGKNEANKGFAYVLFENVAEADLAVKQVNNREIRCFDGLYRLKVFKSHDCRQLFLGGIPNELKKQQVSETVNKFTKGLKNVVFFEDWQDKTKNRGFCFLDYDTHNNAINAKHILATVLPEVWKSTQIKVNWTKLETETNEKKQAMTNL